MKYRVCDLLVDMAILVVACLTIHLVMTGQL